MAKGEVSIPLSDGEHLRFPVHSFWRALKPEALQPSLKTVDLKSAYKQLAVLPRDRCLSIVTIKDPVSGLPFGFESRTLLFGATSSVVSFNRVARLIQRVLITLQVLACNYFDDYPVLEVLPLCNNTQSTIKAALDLLGFSWAEDKDLPFSHEAELLGVRVDLGTFGVVKIGNKPDRAASIAAAVDSVLSEGRLDPKTLPSLFGRIQFAEGQLHGRLGRLALADLRACTMSSRAQALDATAEQAEKPAPARDETPEPEAAPARDETPEPEAAEASNRRLGQAAEAEVAEEAPPPPVPEASQKRRSKDGPWGPYPGVAPFYISKLPVWDIRGADERVQCPVCWLTKPRNTLYLHLLSSSACLAYQKAEKPKKDYSCHHCGKSFFQKADKDQHEQGCGSQKPAEPQNRPERHRETRALQRPERPREAQRPERSQRPEWHRAPERPRKTRESREPKRILESREPERREPEHRAESREPRLRLRSRGERIDSRSRTRSGLRREVERSPSRRVSSEWLQEKQTSGPQAPSAPAAQGTVVAEEAPLMSAAAAGAGGEDQRKLVVFERLLALGEKIL
ncbi:unnamed protein product [Symbiodinium sp. CCMP2592]|nr:unnamed protein product [Symbiodinium sp. CCMP2592]